MVLGDSSSSSMLWLLACDILQGSVLPFIKDIHETTVGVCPGGGGSVPVHGRRSTLSLLSIYRNAEDAVSVLNQCP